MIWEHHNGFGPGWICRSWELTWFPFRHTTCSRDPELSFIRSVNDKWRSGGVSNIVRLWDMEGGSVCWCQWDETELIYIHPLAHRPSATTLPQAVSPTIRDQQCWSTPQHQSWTDFCHNPRHLKRLTAKIRPFFPFLACLLLTTIKPCQKWPVTPHGDLNCLV